jgi:Domain of unknown function (DUF1330)
VFLRTERERNRVRYAFGHYMALALVERLADDPSRLKLGGETRDMTLLFSDVRGVTAISEGLVMAFWNAPLDDLREAQRVPRPALRALSRAQGNTCERALRPWAWFILEFPTFDEAKAWHDSPAYRVREHRYKGADYRAVIVQGL